MASEAQTRLQGLSEEFQSIQKELQSSVGARQKLEAQRQENMTEFTKIKGGEKIFKLVGPVLLEQDKTEANSMVKGRLEFINKELSRTDKQIEGIQGKLEKKKTEILQVQASAQQAAAGPKGGKVPVKA